MFGIRKSFLIVGSAAVILALVIGATALVTTTIASASAARSARAARSAQTSARADTRWNADAAGASAPFAAGELFAGRCGPDGPGGPGDRGQNDQYLADALGITVEELQAAQQAAGEKALALAVEKGLITQEQADKMKESGRGFAPRGMPRGFRGDDADAINFESLLADELGISIEKLQAARQEAETAALAAAVAGGKLTQEQADLMAARQAIREYTNPEAMTATALGISVEDLQAARQQGKSPRDLMEEKGLTQEEFQTAMQSAYEAAVKQAVSDGVITQAQADLLLSNEGKIGAPGDFGGHGGPGGRRGPGGPGGSGDCPPPGDGQPPAAPNSTEPYPAAPTNNG